MTGASFGWGGHSARLVLNQTVQQDADRAVCFVQPGGRMDLVARSIYRVGSMPNRDSSGDRK